MHNYVNKTIVFVYKIPSEDAPLASRSAEAINHANKTYQLCYLHLNVTV